MTPPAGGTLPPVDGIITPPPAGGTSPPNSAIGSAVPPTQPSPVAAPGGATTPPVPCSSNFQNGAAAPKRAGKGGPKRRSMQRAAKNNAPQNSSTDAPGTGISGPSTFVGCGAPRSQPGDTALLTAKELSSTSGSYKNSKALALTALSIILLVDLIVSF